MRIPMAKRSMIREAQNTISDAAKTGAAAVKPVAGAALGAAAEAAAGVVLDMASDALQTGARRADKLVPEAAKALTPGALRSSRRSTKKRSAPKKKAASKKATSKKAAPKKTRTT